MKHRLGRMLASAALAAMLAWGLTNTLLTAFEISDFGVSVDKNRMLLWIMASAVLSAAAAEIKHAGVAGLLPVAGAV